MVHTAVLSQKGQLVIPKVLRDKYGLAKGSKLVILDEGNRLVLEPSDSIVEKLRVFEAHTQAANNLATSSEAATMGPQLPEFPNRKRDAREIA